MKTAQQIRLEEKLNAITHGIGIPLSIWGTYLLVKEPYFQDQSYKLISFWIFGLSLSLVYMASTLYHLIPEGGLKFKLKILDHIAIFILIAGSYTPYCLLVLPKPWGKTLLVAVWSIAFFGTIYKLFFIGKYKRLSTILYLLMGWLIIIAIKPMIDNYTTNGLLLILLGGIFYSGGTIFYKWENLKYNHAIWHIFVLAGSLSHFLSAYFYLLPQ